jgi:hypothetical protein
MKTLDNYECEGQLSLTDCLNFRTLYPIPRLQKRWLDEEGWTDDWHYADKETPTKDDYYHTFWQVRLRKDKEYEYQYTYTTALFHEGSWYLYNHTTKKWQPPFPWYTILIGWVVMPAVYQQSEAFISTIGADIDKDKYRRVIK